MRSIIKQVNILLPWVRQTIFMVGLIFVFIFATLSIAYARGESIGEVRPDFTEIITGGAGTLAYCWMILFFGWLCLEVIHWGFKARGWWLHRSEIRKEVERDCRRLRRSVSKLTGNMEGT